MVYGRYIGYAERHHWRPCKERGTGNSRVEARCHWHGRSRDGRGTEGAAKLAQYAGGQGKEKEEELEAIRSEIVVEEEEVVMGYDGVRIGARSKLVGCHDNMKGRFEGHYTKNQRLSILTW